jgi:hypothetical protein
LTTNTKNPRRHICPASKREQNKKFIKGKKAKTATLEKSGAQKSGLEVKNKQMQVEIRAQAKEIREFKIEEANKEADLRKRRMQEEKQEEEGEEKPSKKSKDGEKKPSKKKPSKKPSKEEERRTKLFVCSAWDPLGLWHGGKERRRLAVGRWPSAGAFIRST